MSIVNRVRVASTFRVRRKHNHTDGAVSTFAFIPGNEDDGDGPIGMIVLSPDAKGGGYSNTIHYTHSSTLRTLEEIFGVTPLLGDAAHATDLSDLFKTFP